MRHLETQYFKGCDAMRPDVSRPRRYLVHSSDRADPARDARGVKIILNALSATPTVLESLQIWKLHRQFLTQQPDMLLR